MDFLYKAEKEELGRGCAGHWGSWLLVSNSRRSGKGMAWRSTGVSSTHMPCDMMEKKIIFHCFAGPHVTLDVQQITRD